MNPGGLLDWGVKQLQTWNFEKKEKQPSIPSATFETFQNWESNEA